MKVQSLANVSKIVSKIANPSSLTPLYRSMELSNDRIRVCSEFGNAIVLLEEDTELANPCLLDVVAVNAVISSLPQDADITLTQKSAKVDWKSGEAKGHLTIVQQDYPIDPIDHKEFPWTPPETFADALQIAGAACAAATVSIGMFGIVIEPLTTARGPEILIASTNSISLAAVTLPGDGYTGGKITLRPPVPGILSAILRSCPGCMLDITPNGIFVMGDWIMASLPVSPDLECDLMAMVLKHAAVTKTAKVDPVAIRKFLARAKTLTDRHVDPIVGLKVEGGKLMLEHRGLAAASEEYFLASGLPTDVNYSSVALSIDMLLIPLEHIETIVLDFLAEHVLVLRGTLPDFQYILGGSAPTA